MSVFSKPSGPKSIPLLGNMVDFGKDPLQFLTKCAQEFGEITRFKLERDHDVFLITNPDDIEYVLMNKENHFSKGYQRDPVMKLLLGNGLVTSEGSFWLKQRRLSQPAFQPKRIASYADTIVELGERMIHSWEEDQVRDIHHDMMQLTMNIATKTLFDLDLEEDSSHESSEALDIVFAEFNKQMTNIYKHVLTSIGLGRFVPPVSRRYQEAVERLDQVIYSIIEERRKDPRDRGDLLSKLISTQDEEGTVMTDQQLRDEIITHFLAGHETTANTLSWAWYLLGQNPAVAERLFTEIREVLGDRLPTYADLPRLTYVEQVIKETLRIQPTVWWISRRAEQEVNLAGYRIPVGSEIAMSQWVMHRDPRYFDEPLTFSPERWNNDNNIPSKFVYFPFGGGPRVCIGSHFAMMESVLLLTMIANHYRIELVKGHPIELEPSITLRPKHGVKVIPHKRT